MARQVFQTICISLFVLCCTKAAIAQYIISGKVLSDGDEKPLAGASVYINGSTIGTTSSETGEFNLPPVPNGFYEVVASYVGYELIVYRATIQSQHLRVTFKLVQKPTELRNIVVTNNAGREKWLKVLRTNFLGITYPALNSKILNEDEILFEEGTGNNEIKAFTAAPLEIVNREFGYRIFFQLEGFYYSVADGRTYFYGYSRFEELKEGERAKAKYIRNRKRYYLGSTMHFFHSLIDNRLREEGYRLNTIRTLTNALPDSGGARIRMGGKMAVALPVVVDSIFRKDSSTGRDVYVLDWKERLQISYVVEPYGKKYLMQKTFMQGGLPNGVVSYFDMNDDEGPVVMDKNGSLFNPLAYLVSGYWSYEKLGNMLPLDYRPPK